MSWYGLYLQLTSMVLWISSSSVHCHNTTWHITTWHIGVLHPAGGIQKTQLSVYNFPLFSPHLHNFAVTKDAKLNYKNKSAQKLIALSIVVCCLCHISYIYIYTCKGVLELCDTLTVFDTVIEGEFFTSSSNFLAAPKLQKVSDRLVAHATRFLIVRLKIMCDRTCALKNLGVQCN